MSHVPVTNIKSMIKRKSVEKDIEASKDYQQLVTYLRQRVMPILQPLQLDILTHCPADIHEFSYFWLQNYKEQQSKQSNLTSDEEEPDQQFLAKLKTRKGKRQKGREGISGDIYSDSASKQRQISIEANKPGDDKIKILLKLRNHAFFKNIPEAIIEELIKCMKTSTSKTNDVIIKEGDNGQEFFLIDFGIFKSVNQSKNQDPRLYGPGDTFGEIGVLYNAKRASTITAVTDGRLFSLDRQSFNTILREQALKKARICETIMSKAMIFCTLLSSEKQKIIESLKEISLTAGKYLIKEGQIGDSFYIVIKGMLVAEKMHDEEKVKSIYYFKEGDYFGQISLIRNVLRKASVKALTSSKLLYLERATLKRLLGPLQKILKRNEQYYRQIKQTAKQAII